MKRPTPNPQPPAPEVNMARKLQADKWLFAATAGLALFGIVMVYSASAVMAQRENGNQYYYVIKQGIWTAIGFGAMLLMMQFDYQRLRDRRIVYGLLTLTAVLLLGVFAFPRINGAHRWIRFAGFSVQPSELFKLTLAIFLAYFLEKRAGEEGLFKRTFIPCFAVTGLMAIGSGGTGGLGFAQGKQKMGFLPFAHSDFIFAVIGEELGLFGALMIVAVFGLLLWRGLRAALRAPDRFGMLLGIGIVTGIVVQALFNISVVLSLLPTKGIPLPFISYGGSSLVPTLMAVGILLNISQRSSAGGKGSGPGGGMLDEVQPRPVAPMSPSPSWRTGVQD